MENMSAISYAGLLEIVNQSVDGIFRDEVLGNCVKELLKEQFEKTQEILDDIAQYDDCSIIEDVSIKVMQNNTVKYEWNKENDQQILYQLLQKIFNENIHDVPTLIELFSTFPSSLKECTNDDILTLSLVLVEELNKNSQNPIGIDELKQSIMEQKLDGETLSNMTPKLFIRKMKKYKITSAKGRQLFNGINGYWNDNSQAINPYALVSKSSKSLSLSIISDTTEPEELEGKDQEETQTESLPSSLEECNVESMVIILDKVMDDKIKPFRDSLIAYLEDKSINGTTFKTTKRKDFIKGLGDHCGNTKANGAALQLHKAINAFDFATLPDASNGDLTPDMVRRIARDLANKKSLNKTHKKIHKSIKLHKVDGRMFMNKFNQSAFNGTNDHTFKEFFHQKICDPKYGTFREWFIKEIKRMENKSVLSKKNITDFTKFVLDGFDEFISHIFSTKKINGKVFIDKGYRSIALEICKEYGMPQGGISGLCHDIENYIKDEKPHKRSKPHQRSSSMLWTIGPSKRILPLIDDDDDDIVDDLLSPLSPLSEQYEGGYITPPIVFQSIESMNECTVDQMVYILRHYVLDSSKLSKHKQAVIEYFVKEKMDGVAFLSVRSKPQFASDLVKGCNLEKKKFTKHCGKLYKALKDFDVKSVDWRESMRASRPSVPLLNGLRHLSASPEIIQSETSVIWNNDITELKECSVEQIVYILNQYIFNKLSEEKKYDNVKANKDVFISIIRNQQIDGGYITSAKRKTFSQDIVGFANDKKMRAPALTVFKLITEFDFSQIIQEAKDEHDVKEEENGYVQVKEGIEIQDVILPQTLEECTPKQLLFFVKTYALNTKGVSVHRDIFISYFNEKQMDGKTFKRMKRKAFGKSVVALSDDNNTKLNGPAMKLHTKILDYKIPETVKTIETKETEEIKDMDIWSNNPSNIEECSTKQIVYIIKNEVILGDKIKKHKAQIIKYVTENNMDGKTLKSIFRKTFCANVVEYLNDKKAKGNLGTMYKALTEYKLPIMSSTDMMESHAITEDDIKHEINGNMDDIWCDNPSNIEDCSTRQIVHIIENEITLKDNAKKHKANIIKYLSENNMDGKKLKSIGRKSFSGGMVGYLKDTKARGHVGTMYKDLTEYTLPITSSTDVVDNVEYKDVSWDNNPRSIGDCTIDQIAFMLIHYVLNSDTFEELEKFKARMATFVTENEYNGHVLQTTTREDFGHKLQSFLKQDGGIVGPGMKLYDALIDFDLLQIAELKKVISTSSTTTVPTISAKAPKKRKSYSKPLSPLDSIEENKPSLNHQKSRSPRSPGHARSPSAPIIAINGLPPAQLQRKQGKHYRHPTTVSNSQNQRSQNEKLAELDENEFYKWVVQCVQNINPSKTVQNMMNTVSKQKINGKKLIKHISRSKPKKLEDFIQTTLGCNEVFFLKYLTKKMIDDYKKVPFENYSNKELSDYIKRQSHQLPADVFINKRVTGDKYCQMNSKQLLSFLRKECGFRAGTARPLIANIDSYGDNGATAFGIMNNTFYKPSYSKYNAPMMKPLGAGYSLHKSFEKQSEYFPSGLNDDAQSDASDAHEYSLSISVNPYNQVAMDKSLEELFADHARKIYKKENERHWRRIKERLIKVGVSTLLPQMMFDDEEKKDADINGNGLDKKYFIKQAKLVYKIDVDRFYDELYKDVMNAAFGFNVSMNRKHTRKWIMEYELNKLHYTIEMYKITRNKFETEMSHKDVLFCKQYMGFLPKKRRKVLWKKLKKDISKGKLNIYI